MMLTKAFIGTLLALSASPLGATNLTRYTLTEYDSLAVCNDGTPAVLYFRAATNESQAGRWVIRQQGGEQGARQYQEHPQAEGRTSTWYRRV
jgi:hypothetical protein